MPKKIWFFSLIIVLLIGYSIFYFLIETKSNCQYADPAVLTQSKENIDYEIVTSNENFSVLKFFAPNNIDGLRLGLSGSLNRFEFYLNGRLVDYQVCNNSICLDNSYLLKFNYLRCKTQLKSSKTASYLSGLAFFIFIILFILQKKKFINVKIQTTFLICLAALLLLFVFRFYNLQNAVIFDWDQARDASVVKGIGLDKKLTLIGPRVFGPTGFFLPPYYYYLLLPFYALVNYHPIAIVNFITLYNLVFLLASIILIKKIDNLKVSFIYILLWFLSPITYSIDRIAWNPLLIPLISLFLIYFISLNLKKWFFWLIIGLIIGVGASFHFQFFLFIPILVPYLNSKFWQSIKKLFLVIFGLIFSWLPIIIFDFRHNFLNFNAFKGMITSYNGKNILAFFPVWRNFVSSFFGGINNSILALIVFVIIPFLIYFHYRQTKIKLWLGLLFVWLSFPIFFMIYSQRPSEYYFNYLLIPFFLSVSKLLADNFSKDSIRKVFLFILIIGYSIWGINKIDFSYENKLGLFYKDNLTSFIKNISGNRKMNISFKAEAGQEVGLDYLLKLKEVDYIDNPDLPLFEIVAPSNKGEYLFGEFEVKIPNEWKEDYWLINKM